MCILIIQFVIMWEKEKPRNHMSMYIFPFV